LHQTYRIMESNIRIKSKLPNAVTTIFTVMNQIAQQHTALNLAQGFPDFEVSPKLISLVSSYMQKGFNQYAPMQGALRLREIVSKSFKLMHNVDYEAANEITITSGATQAIYTAIATIIKPGDEVIVVEPAFDIYHPAIEMHGGKSIAVKLKAPNYSIDWIEFEGLINEKTSMIIINTPHNPTSAIFSETDMLTLQRLTSNTNIVVVSDEVYEHIIFDGLQHQSVCRFPELASRSFVVGSFGKTFHVTGWKIGFCLAPESLMSEFRKIHQNVVFAGNHPMQLAIAEYMEDPENYIHVSQFYQQKRDSFMGLMKDSRFKPIISHGTYFQMFDYSAINTMPDMEFVVWLAKEHKVATIPLSYFYSDNYDNHTIRICFAKNEETLKKAAEILCKI
jgi:methionine transaminase